MINHASGLSWIEYKIILKFGRVLNSQKLIVVYGGGMSINYKRSFLIKMTVILGVTFEQCRVSLGNHVHTYTVLHVDAICYENADQKFLSSPKIWFV